jgi:hypothetical protein
MGLGVTVSINREPIEKIVVIRAEDFKGEEKWLNRSA